MFTKVKINDYQTYWPISQVQADCHNSFSPFGYRTYYLRILPRYGALSQGWFYNYLHNLRNMRDGGEIFFRDVCHCGDCWVYIFDDIDNGATSILNELKRRMQSYEGLPLPDLELVHPINRYVLFSLGIFSGDWQYNKLIEREV